MTRTYHEMVSDAAEYARSAANRAAMCGVFAPLAVYAAKGAIIIELARPYSSASTQGLHYCGAIGGGVPYSQYYARIAELTRNAPLF
jgi:hypothetical protein